MRCKPGQRQWAGEGRSDACTGKRTCWLQLSDHPAVGEGEKGRRLGRRLVSGLGWDGGIIHRNTGETEGRTDFVGEDSEFSFGRSEFEMHVGNPTSAV